MRVNMTRRDRWRWGARGARRQGKAGPRWAWLLLAAAAACDGADEGTAASRRDCEQLRDHVVELRLTTVTADRDHHAAALRAALGESFVSTCLAASPDEV